MSAFSLLLINYLVNLAATDYINYFILLLQYILISINFQWICFFYSFVFAFGPIIQSTL